MLGVGESTLGLRVVWGLLRIDNTASGRGDWRSEIRGARIGWSSHTPKLRARRMDSSLLLRRQVLYTLAWDIVCC